LIKLYKLAVQKEQKEGVMAVRQAVVIDVVTLVLAGKCELPSTCKAGINTGASKREG
jgi:hypothetical protein